MPKIELLLGNCLEKMKDIPDNSVDAIVTDPPYGLEFMGKDWDKGVPGVHFWEEMIRVLKPGGYLLAFGGTRTYHRMATAIEDAGFEVRDMIEWVYSTGFPKSHNIGKAVDKLQGNEREDLGKSPASRDNAINHTVVARSAFSGRVRITKGNSPYEGWGTALKPAHEPICMARNPLEKGLTVAENCLKWGTGGIDIDGSRVGTEERFNPPAKAGKDTFNRSPGSRTECQGTTAIGRFPANLCHDNSEEVRECFPNQSERFFKSIIYQAKASKAERNRGCEGLEAKNNMRVNAPRKSEEKKHANKLGNHHPTVKPIALMEYLINMVSREGQTVLDPFMGSGTTGIACKKINRNFIGIDLEKDYYEIAEKRIGAL